MAREFVNSGNFLWNSGMFFWTLKAFLRELESAQREACQICHQVSNALRLDDLDAANSAFAELPSLSVDYAVMEKAENVWVVEAKFGWDDVGAWDALSRTMEVEQGANLEIGDVLAIDCKDSIFYNESKLKLAAIGIEGIVVVATDDAILIVPKDQAQRVKEIVENLKKSDGKLLE
jgi:mannose-1-phosphate guanylyltransferase